MKHSTKIAIVAAATAASIAALTSPASAAVVEKSGGPYSCSPGHPIALVAHASGTVKYYYPTSSPVRETKGPYSGITWPQHYTSVYSINSWRITSTGYLDNSGTGPYCQP